MSRLMVLAALVASGSSVPDPPSLAPDSGELWRTGVPDPPHQTHPPDPTHLTDQIFQFHHLHLNGAGLAEFYGRLFDPPTKIAIEMVERR